jgi:DNA-binding MarR family transcriptional regulator
MPNKIPAIQAENRRVLRKIQRTARNQRWADARAVLTVGLSLLSHPDDKYIRARFNPILDRVNKQIAAGIDDRELVLDAVARGARDLDRLRDATLFADPTLGEILDELEKQGRIRRISKSTVELRDKARERAQVMRIFRERSGPATTEDVREETGYSRRHVVDILSDLQAAGKISRTRTGFVTTERAKAAREGEHDDDCLCRRCLTPRSQWKTA